MDDPNLMQNSNSISPDKKDNMTSVSSPKRTIVLGVVNTAGMKSTNVNRKRRWDQPPEEFIGTPNVKKLCLNENETFPLKETESPELVTAGTPIVESINSHCENSGVPNQSSFTNSNENEEFSEGALQPHSSHISNEASAMLIDLPEDKSDRLTPTYEPSSNITLCSEPLEKLSEVNVLENCDRLQCNEPVCSNIPDSHCIVNDDLLKVESSSHPDNETKTIKLDQKSSASATVISHQSDELRRIMFSYDEGSSDSDTMESSSCKEENSGTSKFNSAVDLDIHEYKNVCKSDVPQKGVNMQITTIKEATSDVMSVADGSEETTLSGNSDGFISPNTTSSIQLRYVSREIDAFIDNSKSLENLEGIEENLIESQLNIPNKSGSYDTSNDNERNPAVSGTLKTSEENNRALHSPKFDSEFMNNLPEKSCVEDIGHLELSSLNSGGVSIRLKNEFGNRSLDEVAKTVKNVEPVREGIVINVEKDHYNSDEKIVSGTSSEPNIIDYDHIPLQENQSHMALQEDNSEENKTYPRVEMLEDNSCNQEVLNEMISDQAVPCDTGQFLEVDSASTNNSDFNAEESAEEIKKRDIKKLVEANNDSSNLVFRSNMESLLEMDNSVQDNVASRISGTLCLDEDESAKNIKNNCKIHVITPETAEVSLSPQEGTEETHEIGNEKSENVSSMNIQLTTDDLNKSSENETINIDKAKSFSVLKDRHSEVMDFNDKEETVLRSDGLRSSVITANASNDNIIPVVLAPAQELSLDSVPVNVDMSDENGDFTDFNSSEESLSKGISESNLIKENESITKEDCLKENVIDSFTQKTCSFLERDSVPAISKEDVLLSGILVKDMESSTKATSNNIGTAAKEVIPHSNEQTSVVEAVTEECFVSEAELKYDKVLESEYVKSPETNIGGSEPKIDINISQDELIIESVEGQTEEIKIVCDNIETAGSINIIDETVAVANVTVAADGESIVVVHSINSDNIDVNKNDIASNNDIEKSYKSGDCTDNVIVVEIDNAMNSAEGDGGVDQNVKTKIKVDKNFEDEFCIEENDGTRVHGANNITSKVDTEIEMNKEEHKRINNTLENTESDIISTKTEPMKITEIETSTFESNRAESNTGRCMKTENSSLEIIMHTELRSIDNSEIEFSTEETVETEISLVESELCSVENHEITTVETELHLIANTENVLASDEKIDLGMCLVEDDKNSGDKIDIMEQTNVVSRLNSDESIEQSISEEVAVTGDNVESIFANNITDFNIEIEKSTPSETSLEMRTKLDESKCSSGSLKIDKDDDISIETSKESVIQEEITIESSSIEECVIDNSSITILEGGIDITSVDSRSYEGVLSRSPEESKDFVDSIDVSETVLTDETPVNDNLVLEQTGNESLIDDEIKTMAQVVDISDKVVSPVGAASEISFVRENMLQDDTKTLTDDIESFFVEEVVTCESSESDKGMDYELGTANDGMASPSVVLEETCGETESLAVNNQLIAVIKGNTVDSKVSKNTNLIENEPNFNSKNSDEVNREKSLLKHVICNEDLQNEPLLNIIKSGAPSMEMECETTVNSITKTSFRDEGMEIDETPSVKIPDVRLETDNIKVETSLSSLLCTESDLPSVVKNIGINVPLLKTVTNSVLLRKEKPPTPVDEISRSGNVPGLDPKLEPITLRIYKDNLSVKTDDLDSPKKNKSPKLSSELKSQLSPHIKSSENRSSLSPTTKKLEFTLKIAKDVNTNIPRATMSPKNNISPSGIHKSGDILRSELTGDSGRGSPAYISPDLTNKVKLKIPKPSPPGISKEYHVSHMQGSSIKEEMVKIKEEIVDQSTGVSLPKPPIEIGNVFKKMMQTEKSIDSKGEINVLDQSLNSSNPVTPSIVPLVKKRGRPRKILQKVLTVGENDSSVHPNLIASHNPALNHSFGAPPSLEISRRIESSEQMSSRQVRSCRARTKPIVVKTRRPRGGGAGRGGMRGRGGISRILSVDKDPEKLVEKLSEREKAELAKIEERKEKQRLEKIAKNEAKKAKKLARKLKDEERRLKRLREKAEKAEAAAPQVFEEETRMSAPDGSSRGHTPAPASALSRLNQTGEHDESQNSISTPTSSQIKRGRMEIPIDPECKDVRVEHLAEYQWQGSELFMVQEQVSMYLGVKSFKRKYPDLKRRPVEAEERTFLEDSGLVPKSMCDLGLTAVSSAEVLDIMYQDFPEKYEEFRKYVREKQAKEASFKQKAVFNNIKQDKSKGEPREQALEAVAMWNSNLNRERREERRCALDLQTFTVHYPKQVRDKMCRSVPKCGLYPVSLIPGQFSDFYKLYTPTELMYFPLNTVMYGPLKPNERQPVNPSDGSGSESSSSSTSDDSSNSSSSDSESEDEDGVTRECKICNGEKKTNKESHPEILLQCSSCKGLCHPTCQEITPEMLPHIKKYNWHCSNCKKCMQCKNTTKDDKMLFCDLCDRGYHIHCVGLRKAPEGRWHCSVCSICTACGSKDPGGLEWNYEYKKTDKGVRLYQRTLCVPCSKNALM